jgi:hypothetical protein
MRSPPGDVAGYSRRSNTLQQEVPGLVGMEETLDIQALRRAGKSVNEIARITGRNRRTVRRLIHLAAPSPRAPRLVSSKLDPFANTYCSACCRTT